MSTWKLLLRELKRGRRFENDEMELLFQRYVLEANQAHMIHLLVLLMSILLVLVIGLSLIHIVERSDVYDTDDTNHIPILVIVICNMFVYILCLCVIIRNGKNEKFLVYISYIIVVSFFFLEVVLSRATKRIWTAIFFVHITYTLLPIRLLDATVSGTIISLIHIPAIYSDYNIPKSYFIKNYKQTIANTLILVCMNILGVLTHFPGDMAKRKAFNEIYEYVTAKTTIEQETVRQDRLLRSVLPNHLVEEIKKDIRTWGGRISRKIYISSYDPVSILFADICGFTALADRSHPQQVVELLNEVYCRFDKLAMKNRCLRIKMLGDCYYCVSGIPQPTPFHADYCVVMGLDMITTLQSVGDQLQQNLQIRVGIHSGRVNCGVLGLKKWQFDVWSSDVTLANYMEGGGMPGRVHISSTTNGYLQDKYDIDPANGWEREPMLKNMETFFVNSVNLKETSTGRLSVYPLIDGQSDVFFRERSQDVTNILFTRAMREKQIENKVIETLHTSINSRNIQRLKKENCKISLRFKNKDLETKFNKEPDRMLQSYFVAAFLVYILISLVQIIIITSLLHLYVTLGLGFIWTTTITALVHARNYKVTPDIIKKFSFKISRNRCLAQALAIFTILFCYVVTALPMLMSDMWYCTVEDHEYEEPRMLHNITKVFPRHLFEELPPDDIRTCATETLEYPEYTLLYTILVIVMVGAFQIVNCVFKLFVIVLICVVYTALFFTASYFMRTDSFAKYFLMTVTLVSFIFLLWIHSQQSEIIHRLDFVWKIQAIDEKEDAHRLRIFNQKLIDNILPSHVAKRYLEEDQLVPEKYHEQCDSVCILFASITNFSFLEDSSVDNVAILHDIISDFDEILSEPNFRCIEKIKSTGVIYMAASGLSTYNCGQRDDAPEMEHVIHMAQYALRLRLQMEIINERHQQNFAVKTGISVGPVVAGVIGANMPQYDIWGNTVNMASRMYSTGVDNEIQVTEEVATVLMSHGFSVRERGKVFVKGKGAMVTYFLMGLGTSEAQTSSAEYPDPPNPPRRKNTSTSSYISQAVEGIQNFFSR